MNGEVGVRTEVSGGGKKSANAGAVASENVGGGGGGGEVGRGRCGANERVCSEEGRGDRLQMGHERASYDVEPAGEGTYDIARPALAHRHDRRAILALMMPSAFLGDELVGERRRSAGHGPAPARVASVKRWTSRPGWNVSSASGVAGREWWRRW